MTDDFARQSIGLNDAWSVKTGHWRSRSDSFALGSPNPFVCEAKAREEMGTLVAGHVFWNNIRLEVAVKPAGRPSAGLLFAYRDDENHGRVVLRYQDGHSEIALIRVRDGVESVAASKPLLYPADRWTRLEVRIAEGQPVAVLLDGVPLLAGLADQNLFGKIGLCVRNGQVQFDDFSVVGLPEDPKEPLRPVGDQSLMYSLKQEYKRDNRDNRHLFKWAKDWDLWPQCRATLDGTVYSGWYCRQPLIGDFQCVAPPRGGGCDLGAEELAGSDDWHDSPGSQGAGLPVTPRETVFSGRRRGGPTVGPRPNPRGICI
jgi:hypothetical protein